MLRDTFDGAAERYDRARPRYPRPLVAELARVADLGPDSRVLEIAPGTGQLTVPLAEFGCRLTAVELGPSLAAVARRNLSAFPRVDVQVADFERWELPDEPFGLVAIATAYHWFDPAVFLAKAASALRPGGRLAVVTTHHVAGGTQEFFDRMQRCYERWDPSTQPGFRSPTEDETATDTGEFDRSEHFEDVTVWRGAQEITYSTDEYLDVVLTYSGHLAMDEPSRQGLLACLRELLETRHGGRVTKRYFHELITATRTGT
ncbi:Methyltransferase domain-containing protein [Streptomyces sp. 3213]|uniref:class I SAM-dependent methyltransferase n=1 Tax=Streptomyces sp. 3213.3 TaxID=1855348 RepID=UPI000898FE0D|nr:class I SAM-dependent methyltransferase [Streptomyces sp. 3213.3]SEE94707.1 Methyltransferase domain-containing protein [Streptomyces sp. 3213] [Streptomyces sp. 3213.3]